MKLYQALKEKQKLTGEIAALKQRVLNNNSIIKGNNRDYSVNETLTEYLKKEEELIDLKYRIQLANMPITGRIFKLAELKGRKNFLNQIPTIQGAINNRYSEGVTEYDVEITKVEIDKIINELTSEIYRIQDELDEFNHTVDIP